MRYLKGSLLAAVLLIASSSVYAAELVLIQHNQRSGGGTLLTLVINQEPSTWWWDGTYGVANSGSVLTAIGTYEASLHISSNPALAKVLGDQVSNLSIDTAAVHPVTGQPGVASASEYQCKEGTFLAAVGAHGCGNYNLGEDFSNNSTVAYNVGGDATCVVRTLGGDDVSTGDPRGLTARAAGGGCDATGSLFATAGVFDLQVYSNDGTQLILYNGIPLSDPNTNYMTFAIVEPPPPPPENAAKLALNQHIQRSGGGTLSTFIINQNPDGQCPTCGWYWDGQSGVANSGSVLTAIGTYEASLHISSNPALAKVLGDQVSNLSIDTAAVHPVTGQPGVASASEYQCKEGTFLAAVGAHGCGNYNLGEDFSNNSTVAYNVGGDATCVVRTLGGDDVSTGDPRGLTARAAGGGCDATGSLFATAGVFDLQVYSNDGTQLILYNGIPLSDPNTNYMVFDILLPPPPPPSADLSLGMTVQSANFRGNTLLTYTLTLTNAGINASNVSVQDPLPPGTTFVSASASRGSIGLLPGGSAVGWTLGEMVGGDVVTAQIQFNVTSKGKTSITNTAVATSDTPDHNPDNNSATLTVSTKGK